MFFCSDLSDFLIKNVMNDDDFYGMTDERVIFELTFTSKNSNLSHAVITMII